MKLIIQIPAYNEEQTLGATLSALPRTVPGFDKVEWLVINDGSMDKTVEVARSCGVDHIVNLDRHRGLAQAFIAGLEAGLRAYADVIVNTDADNQYCAEDIPKLVEPILRGEADIVIGTRPIGEIRHFSPAKRVFQRVGSWVVRIASSTDVPDAPSGFRAMSRAAAMQLNVFSPYTYTLEMIIQAGHKRMRIISIPVRTNPFMRPSRLMKGMATYLRHSAFTIVRIFMCYRPFRFFAAFGLLPFAAGFALGVRWIWLCLQSSGRTHLPSLILAAILILIGVQLWIFGLIADIIAVNRKLLEDIQLRVRRMELE
jgi:glycosyltransferase involved in cell wall biosynthesis